MKRRKIMLVNEFHGTKIFLLAADRGGLELSAQQVKKARKALCGNNDCACGRRAGDRGGRWRSFPLPDGGANVFGPYYI